MLKKNCQNQKKEFASARPALSNFFPFGVPKGKTSFGGPNGKKKSFGGPKEKKTSFFMPLEKLFFSFGPPKEAFFPFGTPKGKKLLKGGRAGANSFFDFGNFFST